MKKTLGFIALAMLATTGAVAADFTPYVGLGVVADKAGTSAKRMGVNPDATGREDFIIQDAGGKMDFDAVMAAEITAGIKYGNLRAELEFAMRGASEDDYTLFNGDIGEAVGGEPDLLLGTINTSTSVKHNSYIANVYYDFNIAGSNWTPYIGAGMGVGTYQQKAKATPDIKLNDDMLVMLPEYVISMLKMEMAEYNAPISVKRDRTAFEWQVAVGTAYHFTPNWAADIAYRFNSSTIDGEFVYAHELKLGARYSF